MKLAIAKIFLGLSALVYATWYISTKTPYEWLVVLLWIIAGLSTYFTYKQKNKS